MRFCEIEMKRINEKKENKYRFKICIVSSEYETLFLMGLKFFNIVKNSKKFSQVGG